MDLNNKKILVTGGKGFLGKVLVPLLEKKGARVFAIGIEGFDLTKEEQVRDLFESVKPEIIIHLAANFGNLEYLQEKCGEIFYDNVMMNTFILEYSKKYKVEKFIGIGTAFSYPEDAEIPLKEKDLWKGDVEQDSACYSLPKKLMLVQLQAYRKQFNLNTIYLILASLYGPGANISGAIPSMIKKFDNAMKDGENSVEFWGTGDATRDLLYVEDAAEAVVLAAEAYDKGKPINIGTGREIKMTELVEKIAEIMKFKGEIIWDKSKPEGPKRILLDSSKAKEEFGFEAKTSLEEGLRKTIESLVS